MTKKKKINKLSNIDLNKVSAGGDTDSLKFSGKEVPLPDAKSKKPIDGGYTGKISPKTANN